MSKAQTLATTVSTGNVLADGTVTYAEVSGTPTLATVATSGSYTDLTDKPTISTTATNIAGGSNGTIPYQTAADTTAMLGVGTAGQVLQTNGAGAPSWVTPAGGAMVFLSEIIVSSAATADIETTFDSTYDEYVLVATNVKSVSDSQQLRCRLKINGTYQTTVGYYNHQNQSRSNSASYSATSKNGDTEIVLATTTGSATTESIHFRMHISNPTSTTRYHSIDYQGAQVDANGASSFVNGVGHYNTTGALTGVRIYCASGNVLGTFRLYGIAKA